MAPGFDAWRDRLLALHPRFLRVPIYWHQLQPDPAQPADLRHPADGCLRGRPPCGAFSGIADELAAIAALQRAGLGVPQVQIVIAGVPDWAANPASGCERKDAGPRSRPINAAGAGGLQGADHPGRRAGRRSRARRSGGGAHGTSPTTRRSSARSARPAARTRPRWRPPSTPSWCSPPRPRWTPRPAISSSCSARWPGRRSPRHGARPSRRWSPRCPTRSRARAARGPSTTTRRSRRIPASPIRCVALEQALDARPCTKGAHIWVTETGVGGDNAGRPAADRRRVAARAVPRPGRRAASLGRRSARRRGVPVHLPRGHGLSRRPRRRRPHPRLPDLRPLGRLGRSRTDATRRPRCPRPAPERRGAPTAPGRAAPGRRARSARARPTC